MKTNIDLVAFAEKAVNERWGYVYGTFGQVLTETILQQKLKQYPDNISPYLSFIRSNWLGKRTVDCVGLIKAYLWTNDKGEVIYDPKTDVSANTMYLKATVKGPLSEIPEKPGVLVWRNGHIGVYVGNGQVIEAKGTKYGVVKTPLTGEGSNRWTNWCLCPFIDYLDQSPFKDVDDSHWAYDYIAAAKELGLIVGGSDGLFGPDEPLTRAQAATIIVKLYRLLKGGKV